jgi:dihydrofolate reductase
MGRKAYEDCPKETLEMFKDKKIYVGTSKNLTSEFKNIEFVNEGIVILRYSRRTNPS